MRSVAVVLALFAATPAKAEAPPPLAKMKTVRVNRPLHIHSFWDCRDPDHLPVVSGETKFGTLEVRVVPRERCGKLNHPVAEVIYTPRWGFRGKDWADIRSGSATMIRREQMNLFVQ